MTPTLSVDAVQDKLIWELEIAVAVRFAGTVGAWVSAGGAVTVKVKFVVRVTLPAAPVTTTVESPMGVVAAAVRVRNEVQVGLQDVGENEEDAPRGRPEAVNDTGSDVPEARIAVMVSKADEP